MVDRVYTKKKSSLPIIGGETKTGQLRKSDRPMSMHSDVLQLLHPKNLKRKRGS